MRAAARPSERRAAARSPKPTSPCEKRNHSLMEPQTLFVDGHDCGRSPQQFFNRCSYRQQNRRLERVRQSRQGAPDSHSYKPAFRAANDAASGEPNRSMKAGTTLHSGADLGIPVWMHELRTLLSELPSQLLPFGSSVFYAWMNVALLRPAGGAEMARSTDDESPARLALAVGPPLAPRVSRTSSRAGNGCLYRDPRNDKGARFVTPCPGQGVTKSSAPSRIRPSGRIIESDESARPPFAGARGREQPRTPHINGAPGRSLQACSECCCRMWSLAVQR
eukprot:COSAG04_NODE_7626_length_1095_cov_2.530120_1_plen_278_part_00